MIQLLTCLWAVLPFADALYFSRVPIARLTENGEGMSFGEFGSGFLCTVSYLLAVFSPSSALSLIGCGLSHDNLKAGLPAALSFPLTLAAVSAVYKNMRSDTGEPPLKEGL